VIFKT